MLTKIDLSTPSSFMGLHLCQRDFGYKKSLQKGLKESFVINCKLEDLNSIAGPVELKNII